MTEQAKIVEKLDNYHQLALELKDRYIKKLEKLRSLKQSLLNQAFSESAVE